MMDSFFNQKDDNEKEMNPSNIISMVYINNVHSRVNIGKPPYYTQNPYMDRSKWPSLELLFTDQNRTYDGAKECYIHDMFKQRYTILNHNQESDTKNQQVTTATRPFLYHLEPTESYKTVILTNSLSINMSDLIMKQTPFYDPNLKSMIHPKLLCEIYNEIIIAYFINELFYGYKQVLSIHFMTIMDWFIGRKETITKPPPSVLLSSSKSDEYRNIYKKYHQVVILEKADVTLRDYLLRYARTAKSLKAVLFQLFDALEVAWYTNEFIHHEPHMFNIMLKKISDCSPLKDKHFLYKRMMGSGDVWNKIDRVHLNNHYVKIVDFGRSRMYVPRVKHEKGCTQRVHDRLVEPPDYSHLGYSSGIRVNRHVDVYTVLLTILLLDEVTFWYQFRRDPTHREFLQFCDTILPFETINNIIDNMSTLDKKKYPKVSQDREKYGGRIKNTSCLVKCVNVLVYLFESDVFIYKHFQNDEMNVSIALNNPYFDEYRHVEPLTLDDKENSVVVSFPTHHEHIQIKDEEESSSSSSLSSSMDISMDYDKPHCSVCAKEDVRCVLNDGNIFLCESKLCYEFMYLFNSKTVFR